MRKIGKLHGLLILLLAVIAAWPHIAQDATADEQRDYIVQAFVSDNTPYRGQQILYGLRYYAYTLPPGLSDELPDFEGFWLADIYELSGDQVETIDNRQYIVGEVYAEITPLVEGELVIDPAVLDVPETVFSDGIRLETETIALNVQPLPPGAPDAFNGAVGQFNAEAAIDRNTITLGEPVTLTLTVDGTGNLEQLPAPPLPDVLGWRVFSNPARYTASAVGGLRLGQKTFEWLLIPEQAGSQQYPPVTFAFFDPELEAYRTIETQDFAVEVAPGADNLLSLPETTEIQTTGQGTLPIRAVPAALRTVTERPNLLFWLLWVIPPGVALVIGGLVYGRRYQQQRNLRFRQSTALKRVIKRLQAARTADPHKSGRQIEQTINAYLADRSGKPDMQLTDLTSVDPKYIEALSDSLTQAESLRYAPPGEAVDVQPLVARIVETLIVIDRTWAV